MRDIRFKAYVGWGGRNSGVARVGTATVAPAIDSLGYDRIGYPFTSSFGGLYDNVSGPDTYSIIDFRVTRGREDRWAGVIAGECSATFSDKLPGRYNPENTASVLWDPVAGRSLVRPLRPFKLVSVLEDGVTEEDLFYGWLDESQDDPDRGSNRASFNFKDLYLWLDGDNPVIAPTGPIYVGEAIGLILDWFDWTNPLLRSLANGLLLPDFSADGTRSGTQLIGEILTVDLGIFFHSRKNVATYYDRYEYSRRVSLGQFQASKQVIPGVKLSTVRNRITVEYDGGVAGPQTYEDTISREEFGPRAWSDVKSTYFGSDAAALIYGQYKVAQSKEPMAPLWTYTVSEGLPGDFDKIARMDLIDRLTIGTRDYHVEKLVHQGAEGLLFQSDLTLSRRPDNLAALVGHATVAPAVDTPGYARVAY